MQSCSKKNYSDKRAEQLEKQDAAKKVAAEKARQAALKHINSIQSKRTKKELKRLKKKSNNYNTHGTDKKFFLFRWFSENEETPQPFKINCKNSKQVLI